MKKLQIFLLICFFAQCASFGKVQVQKDDFSGKTSLTLEDHVSDFSITYTKSINKAGAPEAIKMKIKQKIFVFEKGDTLDGAAFFKINGEVYEVKLESRGAQVVVDTDSKGKVTDEDLIVTAEINIDNKLSQKLKAADSLSLKCSINEKPSISEYTPRNIERLKKFLNWDKMVSEE